MEPRSAFASAQDWSNCTRTVALRHPRRIRPRQSTTPFASHLILARPTGSAGADFGVGHDLGGRGALMRYCGDGGGEGNAVGPSRNRCGVGRFWLAGWFPMGTSEFDVLGLRHELWLGGRGGHRYGHVHFGGHGFRIWNDTRHRGDAQRIVRVCRGYDLAERVRHPNFVQRGRGDVVRRTQSATARDDPGRIVSVHPQSGRAAQQHGQKD